MSDQKTVLQGVYRASDSNALINKDGQALKNYKKRKQQSRKINNHDERIAMLEQQVARLEELLGGT
jgi:hypothetical protein